MANYKDNLTKCNCCGHSVIPSDNYCRYCGHNLLEICPFRTGEQHLGDRICPNVGSCIEAFKEYNNDFGEKEK